jgi:phage gpG-like protein
MANPSEILTKLEALKDWQRSAFPRLAARRAEAFFKNNFREQGYIDKGKKPWAKRKMDDRKGGAILIGKQSGLLRDSIRAIVSGSNIVIESSRIYAQIHNEGGTIVQTVTPKQKGFFWAKHYEAKERNNLTDAERWKRMALSKTLTINMPQRQFMPIKGSGALPFELGEILRGDVEKKLEGLF